MIWFFLLFFVSGFCSILYEIVWLRLAMAQFGVTSALTSIVLSMFMAGLGLGSWGAGRASPVVRVVVALVDRWILGDPLGGRREPDAVPSVTTVIPVISGSSSAGNAPSYKTAIGLVAQSGTARRVDDAGTSEDLLPAARAAVSGMPASGTHASPMSASET